MTERLYYHDSRLLEFEATITRIGQENGGVYTVLDRTAFYPTSGGQSHDTGRINDVEVIDVQETAEGEVRHFTGRKTGEVGATVTGVVDGERRRRHCCLHTAQHMLSHVFFKLFDMPTVSVHLGEEYGAVELDGAMPSTEQLNRAEDRVNEMIREAHPVIILFAEGEEVSSLPLRRPAKKPGRLRVVRIGDFEWSACGGTHCRNTAELGVIKLIGLEKLRGHPLVKFLSADAAFKDYRARFDVTSALTQELTCGLRDLPERVTMLTNQNRSLRQDLASLYRELLPRRAENLAAQAKAAGRALVCGRSDLPESRLSGQLAALMAAEVGGVALLLHETRLFLACVENGPHDAGALAKMLNQQFGLKGGGSRSLAQLGGADPERLAEYESFLTEVVQE